MTAAVERGGDLAGDVLDGGRAGSQEARADPGQQDIAAHVVGGHDDHTATATGADPVLGQRYRLGGARAGGVDLRVGAAGADQLGELRVPHRQTAEDEAAVVLEALDLQQVAQFRDPPIHLGGRRFRAGHPCPHGFQGKDLLAPATVGHVLLDVGGEFPVPGEGRGEDDAGVVAHGLRQSPSVG